MNKRRQKTLKAYQPSLFDPQVETPAWSALEPDIRATVTRLFAQILRAHWEREGGHLTKEVGDE